MIKLQTLGNRYWLLFATIVALHQLIQRGLGFSVQFVDHYLDAFLSIPILLGLMLQERQLVIERVLSDFKATSYWFSWLEVAVATVLLAVIFEEVLPIYCTGYTRDNWDYLAYGSGAICFDLLINRPK